MKTWEKPELYVEEFELSQHVAAGCEYDLPDIKPDQPGGVVKVNYGCARSDGTLMTGVGHWHTDKMIYDDNQNGKIDWNEFTKYAEVADNGNITGQGHQNHTPVLQLPNGTIVDLDQKPFTS